MNPENEIAYAQYIQRRNKADKLMGEIILTYMEPDTPDHVLVLRARHRDKLITEDEYKTLKEVY